MDLNPYAKYLGKRNPMEVLENTHSSMVCLFDRFTREEVEQRLTPGKWSVREIVAHLADCELVFGFRLRQTLAEASPILQPFDQDKWARRYANHDFDAALRMFDAARNWNLLLLYEATAADRSRLATHPERGTMTFQAIVETMAGHDLNHLQQIERLADSGS